MAVVPSTHAQPVLAGYGQLSFRGASVYLSPAEEPFARELLASFGAPVSVETLRERAESKENAGPTLRVHISRLRRRIAPLGIVIKSVRNFGYVMTERPHYA
jgi:DNA-binding response OmpR family regulator